MKLIPEKYDKENFTCELTKELDKEFIREDLVSNLFHHYIMYFNTDNNEIILALRHPGRTIGGVWVNPDTNEILRIELCYPTKDQEKENRVIQKFIRAKIYNLKELLK